MTRQGKLTVWAAMLMSNLMMLIALTAIPQADEPNRLLGKALLAAGMVFVPFAAALPRLVKAPQAWLAALAICEGAAVCGILAHVLAALPQAWMLPVMGFAGTGLLFPQKDQAV
jgi:hypothetical protein